MEWSGVVSRDSNLKDTELVEKGRVSFDWARSNMPAFALAERHLRSEIKKFGRNPLRGKKIAASLHVSKETSVLIAALVGLGAEITLVAANPLSSQPEMIAYLSSIGVEVNAKRGETEQEYKKAINSAARKEPDLIIDDGAELHVAYSSTGSKSCIGGTDETTSGTDRLRVLAERGRLRYPVFAVNEAQTKHIFDNRYGTGQSTMDGLLRATSLLIAGKVVVVAGYGWVGSGVALRARGLGARVIVTEVNPVRALEAHLNGFEVQTMNKAAELGDIFLTCTGQTDVIRREHFLRMRGGAIVGNAGHFNREIDVKGLFRLGDKVEQVREGLTRVSVNGKSIFLLTQGRVVNLASAEGHPPEVMQFSFSNQLLCLYRLAAGKERGKGVLQVPKEIDDLVASLSLKAFHLRIDSLSSRQTKYAQTFTR